MKKVNEQTYDLENVPSNEYQSSRPVNTSSTTERVAPSNEEKPTLMVKKKDLADSRVKDSIKHSGANYEVVDESKHHGLVYLSEIKDEKTGKISEPFTIDGKKYQIVRAKNAQNEKVQGVYSFDETDEHGKNKIYDIKEFEESIVKPIMTEKKEETTEKVSRPSFAGYKHFIVNKKTGKSRKFGSLEELAKAQMQDDEEYMGLKQFKKYVDEVLFGGSRRQMKEQTPAAATTSTAQAAQAQQTTPKVQPAAKKVINYIQRYVSDDMVNTVKQVPLAQKDVITYIAGRFGVPASQLSAIINTEKQLAKQKPQPQNTSTTTQPQATQTTQTSQTVSESQTRRVIKTFKKKEL